MPTGARIRTNNVQGTISDNPLLAASTTMNSAGLANLAAVSSNHAVIIIDPLRTAGAPEIVVVTAHTGAATSATVTRGAYGTTARQHALGVAWVHAPTIEDTVQILTSATRPSDPYRGQLIFETDTNSYVGRDTSDAWQTAVPLGAWTTYTPTFTNFTLGNGTLTAGYQRVGRRINFVVKVVLGSTSVMGTNPQYTLPVAAASRYSSAAADEMGRAHINDAATAEFSGPSMWVSSTVANFYVWGSAGTYVNAVVVSATVPMTWTTSDVFMITGTYEAAS